MILEFPPVFDHAGLARFEGSSEREEGVMNEDEFDPWELQSPRRLQTLQKPRSVRAMAMVIAGCVGVYVLAWWLL